MAEKIKMTKQMRVVEAYGNLLGPNEFLKEKMGWDSMDFLSKVCPSVAKGDAPLTKEEADKFAHEFRLYIQHLTELADNMDATQYE